MKGGIRMGIVKKIFESSKSKDTQKKRREFIDKLIECDYANKFEEKINNRSEIEKLFGADEKKSDTLKFINQIRDLVHDLKENKTGKETSITDLLNGKIPNGKKPSSIATITSKDCKNIGTKFLFEFYKIIIIDNESISIESENLDAGYMCKLEAITSSNIFSNVESIYVRHVNKIPKGFSQKIKIKNIKEIVFWNINEIEEKAFENLKKLQVISFIVESGFGSKKTLKKIGDDAFKGCDNLKKIIFEQNKKHLITENIRKSIKNGCFKEEVAKKLKIGGLTYEEWIEIYT